MTRQATDADVFDTLHELFGIGDFDDADGHPWYRWRAGQIVRIKNRRRGTGAAPERLIEVAHYCRRHKIRITQHWELYQYLPDLRRENTRQALQEKTAAFEAAYADAIAAEAAENGSPWLDRLILAAGDGRAQVFDDWRAWRARQDAP